MNEETLEWMAKNDPSSLLELIRSGLLAPPILTYAAEIAGIIDDPMAVQEALLPLLDHQDAVVREGAIYGLASHLDALVRVKLRSIALADTSQAVREAAKSALGDEDLVTYDPEVASAKVDRFFDVFICALWLFLGLEVMWKAFTAPKSEVAILAGVFAVGCLTKAFFVAKRAFKAHLTVRRSTS